jgi:hypothetical protein
MLLSPGGAKSPVKEEQREDTSFWGNEEDMMFLIQGMRVVLDEKEAHFHANLPLI